MWGIVKVVIAVVVVVFLVQLLLSGVTNLLNSNTNVKANWRTSMPMDQEVQFHEIPATDLWTFVPRPVYRAVTDAIDAAVRFYEDGKRAVLRAWPARGSR